MNKTTIVILTAAACLLSLQSTRAGSATWSPNPVSGDWNTAANWVPATVPNGPNDVATFGVSNITVVSISSSMTAKTIVYSPGASSFAIITTAGASLSLVGTGVQNDSGGIQNFIAARDGAGGSIE